MIKTSILFISIISTLPVLAQEADTALPSMPERKNEVGIFTNSAVSNNSSNGVTLAGVQYKRWVTPNKAYRSLAAYGQYNIYEQYSANKPFVNDTFYSIFTNAKVNMAYIGAGVEMQRHFYKRVYLFAALELRAGTGQGRGQDLLATQYKEPGSNYLSTATLTPVSFNNIRITQVDFVPSIGGKFQFNRISFGTELTPIDVNYKSVNKNGTSNSLFNLNLGEFSGRFFFNFRF